MPTLDKAALRELAATRGNGFKFSYSKAVAYFFQREIPATRTQISATEWKLTETKYEEMRLLASDLEPKNFALMVKLGLTNTNKA